MSMQLHRRSSLPERINIWYMESPIGQTYLCLLRRNHTKKPGRSKGTKFVAGETLDKGGDYPGIGI
jgi:hypothetical protein